MNSPKNIRAFYAFRVFFNARFYYPVFAILFLDFGLTLKQFALLNTIWAATIVLLEVPSGALADALGRVRLLRIASWLMVLEMLLILLAPMGNPPIVFTMLLLNRVVSGAAEAMASGADEALAYDSLAAEGNETLWPLVLERVMRYRSLGFMVTMILGGMLYDAALINKILALMGIEQTLDANIIIRLPVLATLFLAFGACMATARMVDPGCHVCREGEVPISGFGAAWKLMLATGRKVVTHPVMFLVILAGVFHDSIMRMMLTLVSEFYRLIGIPETYYGLLGALMACMGLLLPALGRRLVKHHHAPFNFALVALLTLPAFVGIAMAIPIFSAAFIILMMAAFSLLNYLVSFYLNREADSRDRATILSFKGLAYNLGYGTLGLIYAGYCRVLEARDGFADTDSVFAHALWGFPAWFAASLLVLLIIALLTRRPKSPVISHQ